MIPVTQTRFGGNPAAPGNCFAACIASIFEVPIRDVPDEMDAIARLGSESRAWAQHWIDISDWLRERFGVGMIEIQYKSLADGCGGMIHDDDCICIVSGKSPRGIQHAVVGKGIDVIHDPHPSGDGIVGDVDSVVYFVALDPANCQAKKVPQCLRP